MYDEKLFEKELMGYIELNYAPKIIVDKMIVNEITCFIINNPGWSIKRSGDILKDVVSHMMEFCNRNEWDVMFKKVSIIID